MIKDPLSGLLVVRGAGRVRGFCTEHILVPVLVTYCKTTLGCENTAKDNKSPWYLVVSQSVLTDIFACNTNTCVRVC